MLACMLERSPESIGKAEIQKSCFRPLQSPESQSISHIHIFRISQSFSEEPEYAEHLLNFPRSPQELQDLRLTQTAYIAYCVCVFAFAASQQTTDYRSVTSVQCDQRDREATQPERALPEA